MCPKLYRLAGGGERQATIFHETKMSKTHPQESLNALATYFVTISLCGVILGGFVYMLPCSTAMCIIKVYKSVKKTF